MKKLYISNLKNEIGKEVVLYGWIAAKRSSKNFFFLDLVDSTGKIQVICKKTEIIDIYKKEQSIMIVGTIVNGKKGIEVLAKTVELLGDAKFMLSPSPREDFDIFSEKYVDYVQKNKHLFVRNPRVIAALKARALVILCTYSCVFSTSWSTALAAVKAAITPILLYGAYSSASKPIVLLSFAVIASFNAA